MTPRLHLASLVDDMRRHGAQAAVVEHRGVRRFPTSYAALAQGATWFAAELIRREIKPGERVVLWGANSAAWIACFFGCVLRGVLVVPLDAVGTLRFAERVIRETSPRLLVGDPLLLLSFTGQVEQMSLAQVDAAMRRAADTAPAEPPVAEGLGLDTPLQILFTSGTTDEPKGIVHTHRNLLASLTPIEREVEKYRRYERLVHPLHFLHTLPLSHVFGQFMGLWVAPVLGAVVHYESRLEAGRLLRLLRQEHISVLAAVPRVLALLRTSLAAAHPGLLAQLADARQTRIGKRWWRFRGIHGELGYRFWAIVCGGATLPAELEDFWTTLGIALVQGYGMTETSALVTLNHPFKPARGTLGAVLPGRELRISDDGELLVRGEMVAAAVWKDGALRVSAAGSDGWLATGDLTSRDEQGRLRYLGRTGQRLVTSAGLNVYLEDVEAMLNMQVGIDAAVALAIEGAQGPEPAAVIEAGEFTLGTQAVANANAGLAPHQRIGRWWLWPGMGLPRTATGKIRRGLIEAWVKERLREEAAGPIDALSDNAAPGRKDRQHDPLLSLIAATIGGNFAAPARLDLDAREELSLESLGVDSLGRVQLQAELDRATGRSIDDRQMGAARTLADLRRLCAAASLVAAAGNEVVVRNGITRTQADAGPIEAATATEAVTSGGAHPRALEASIDPRSLINPAELLPGNSQVGLDRRETFLFLRWPWAAPVQLLRTAFLEACVRPLVWLLAAPRVERRAMLGSHGAYGPASGANLPLLIVANHVSTYDVPLLLYALPAHLRRRVTVAMAGQMLEDWRHGRGNALGPVIYWLLTILFNVFPLPRTQGFRRAFLHAGAALDRGYSVLVFPEGARSHGGPMQPFRGGIGLLAQEAAVQVLPVALRQSWVQGIGLHPYAATICLGDLVTVRPGEEAHSITARLQGAVQQLLDASV